MRTLCGSVHFGHNFMQNLSDFHLLGCPASVLSYDAYIAIALLYTPKAVTEPKNAVELTYKTC